MAPGNGKADGDPQALDLEHELPAADENEEATSTATVQPEELERLCQERDTLLDRLARLQAEFDNFRKRNAREQQEFRDYALADAIQSLLPVVDSFDRALHSPVRDSDEFHAGIELINRQFHDALAKLGVQPIAARGEPFDPNLHQAVQMVETDEAEHHHVLDELQRGYKLKNRLLRPAMVRVATNPKK
ncbi:MAG: nucleotide exchange factor GrpE [Terriglobales bacterium]|jgi:molecular chaperone GrpE